MQGEAIFNIPIQPWALDATLHSFFSSFGEGKEMKAKKRTILGCEESSQPPILGEHFPPLICAAMNVFLVSDFPLDLFQLLPPSRPIKLFLEKKLCFRSQLFRRFFVINLGRILCPPLLFSQN